LFLKIQARTLERQQHDRDIKKLQREITSLQDKEKVQDELLSVGDSSTASGQSAESQEVVTQLLLNHYGGHPPRGTPGDNTASTEKLRAATRNLNGAVTPPKSYVENFVKIGCTSSSIPNNLIGTPGLFPQCGIC
jgi:hypothetical protein